MTEEEFNELDKAPRQRRAAPSVDRLPPHDPAAEQGILGCITLDPNSIITCIERLKGNGLEFYDLRHQTIYGTMLELHDDQIPIDLISLQARLKLWDKLEQCGGIPFLSALADAVPSSANLPYYVDIVLEKFALRNMIRICTEAVSKCFDHKGGTVNDLLEQVEYQILHASEARIEPVTLTMPELVQSVIHDIEEACVNPGVLAGLATGYADLDHITNGLQAGDMMVLAGRPSTGKSSLAMNIAEKITIDSQLPVGVCSLEMTAKSLVRRVMLSRARVSLKNTAEGFLSQNDFPKITQAAAHLMHAKMYIDETAGQSLMQVRAKFRRWKQKYDIKLGIVDYMQLMHVPGSENRQNEVAAISKGLKNLAKELGIPMLVLCQMNRDIEREKNRRPRLADLRESGSIEQDADIVGMLYRLKGQFDDEDDNSDVWQIKLVIAKNRNGPTGDVNLVFIRSYTRFEPAAQVLNPDEPPPQNTQAGLI